MRAHATGGRWVHRKRRAARWNLRHNTCRACAPYRPPNHLRGPLPSIDPVNGCAAGAQKHICVRRCFLSMKAVGLPPDWLPSPCFLLRMKRTYTLADRMTDRMTDCATRRRAASFQGDFTTLWCWTCSYSCLPELFRCSCYGKYTFRNFCCVPLRARHE